MTPITKTEVIQSQQGNTTPHDYAFSYRGLGNHSRMAGRSLSSPEAERVRGAIRELVRKHGTQTIVAEMLEVKQAHVSAMLRAEGPAAPGIPVARRVANVLGMSLDQLLSDPDNRRIVRDERYPNRAVAAEFARADGVSEQAIRNVCSWNLKSDTDPMPREWLEDMRAEDRKLLRERLDPVGTKAAEDANERRNLEEIERLKNQPTMKDRIAAIKKRQGEEQSVPEPPNGRSKKR